MLHRDAGDVYDPDPVPAGERTGEEMGESIVRGAGTVVICGASDVQATVQLSFTTTAAVLGVTVVFLYATAEKLEWKDAALLFFLLFLTSQVRFDIFCMTVPVCAVLWIFRVAVQGQRERIQFLMPAAALAVLALAMLGNLAGYGSAEWRAYKAYDNSRTAIYDFPDYTFPEYEGAEEALQQRWNRDKKPCEDLD